MEICTIASGSKGNTTLITAAGTNILIDCGISYADYKKRIAELGFTGRIDGVLVTHIHSDHIKGLRQLAEKQDTLVYAHKYEWRNLGVAIGIDVSKCRSFNTVFRVGNVDVLPFATPHDVPCYGYTLDCNGERISIVTDIGEMTEGILDSIKDSKIVLIESNYDENMLISGKYPYPLKQRILSREGHLSNYDCAAACATLARSGVKKIILGHLSENNNTEELAYSATAERLSSEGIKIGADIKLYVAGQHSVGKIICTSGKSRRKYDE